MRIHENLQNKSYFERKVQVKWGLTDPWSHEVSASGNILFIGSDASKDT